MHRQAQEIRSLGVQNIADFSEYVDELHEADTRLREELFKHYDNSEIFHRTTRAKDQDNEPMPIIMGSLAEGAFVPRSIANQNFTIEVKKTFL